MKLKPLRFIGHKIGPFNHIELNWEKDSRHTLIVAENGMGKTTLVAAMAACLSFGNENLFPSAHFERFAHDEESLAYLELDLGNGQRGWLLQWALPIQAKKKSGQITGRKLPPGLPDLGKSFTPRPGQWSSSSPNLAPTFQAWHAARNVNFLAAAYGVGRDIQRADVQEYQELERESLKNILNPFSPIQSSEIFQWIVNQRINYALALTEDKEDEAQNYLAAIQRVEQLFNEGLKHPVSFQVKRNPFRLEVRQNGTTLSVEQLSDGTRSFLSWPLDYLMRASRVNWENPTDSVVAPGLVLVDEIDAHLHPEWQRRAMSVVSQLLPETYVIATTHSPFVLGATDDAQVFQIYKDADGQLKVKSGFDELYGYPADLVLQKAFVPSLYPPEMEQKLERLSKLAGKVTIGDASLVEKQEHDALLEELAAVNPWLENLLALSQAGGPTA